MRKELETQNRGGAVRRFVDQPPVLVVLFLLCAGTLAWTFWPADPEKRRSTRRPGPLLESDDPEDWMAGWERLKGVKAKLISGPHAADVTRYEQKIADYQAARGAGRRGDRLRRGPVVLRAGAAPAAAGRTPRRHGRRGGASSATSATLSPSAPRWPRREGTGQGGRCGRRPALGCGTAGTRPGRTPARRGETAGGGRDPAALEELYHDDPSAKEILDEVRHER